jgi:hypothetical protein
MNFAPYEPNSNDILLVSSGKCNNAAEFEMFAIQLDPETTRCRFLHRAIVAQNWHDDPAVGESLPRRRANFGNKISSAQEDSRDFRQGAATVRQDVGQS